MSQEAYEKFGPEVREGGTLIVEEDLVRLAGHHNGIRIYGIPATRLAEELGKKMVLNVVMAGFFAAVTGVTLVDTDALKKAVKESVPQAAVELNLRAFERGFQYGLERKARVEVAAEEPAVEMLES
jgi:2-oxoglutarate ferredoxin oxidoreductase subunit gamma